MRNKRKSGPGKNNIAVFLDRDGTINDDKGYINHPDRIELIPRSALAIRRLNKEGILTIIVSNQSGVARGYFKKELLPVMNKRLENLLKAKKACIDDIYYCPHHPDDNCSCRKPKVGMLKKAAKKFGLDLRKCFVVGDKYSDIVLGHNAEAITILVLTGYGKGQWEYESQKWKNKPDYVAEDLYEAVKWIIKQIPKDKKSR